MENLQVREVPIQLPIEVHAYYEFDESERGREYEMRLVIAPDQGGQESTSPAFPLMTNQSRHRVTLRGFRVPAFGGFHVFAEIRPRDEARQEVWRRSAFGWPLVVTEVRRVPASEKPEAIDASEPSST